MRYAVTGATGFVGGALARRLRADGHDVVALVREPTRAGDLAVDGVELLAGDLDDTAALHRLCDGVDGLFHVAGWYKLGQRDSSAGERVNVTGTRNVLAAAAHAGLPRVVHTSTLAVNSDTHGAVVDEEYRFTGEHLSVYDRTKAEAHAVAERFAAEGLPVVIVQPGLVYGPKDTSQTGRLLADAAHGRRTLAPAGGGVCWGHVQDVALGHVLAMERGEPGRCYMLAGPRASLADGLRRLAELGGGPAPVVVPAAMIGLTAAATGVLGRLLPVPATYAAETLRASLATYYGDPGRAERELGWSARPLDEGLRELLAAAREAGS